MVKLAQPLFSRSPVRGSVTRVRTSTTAMLGGGKSAHDPIVKAVRARIARFSGYAEPMIEPLQVAGPRYSPRYVRVHGCTAASRLSMGMDPLQVVRYEQGQKYEAHHDFFDVCDLEDKTSSGRRTVRPLGYY